MNVGLIVAGGSGLRMKSTRRKQYIEIGGKPVIAQTILVFERCEKIDRIILVLPKEDISMVSREILSSLNLKTPVELVPGGQQRQDSVFNGLNHLKPNCQIVVIHDGVRPFVLPDQITASISEAAKSGACILGIPAFDTLKRVIQDNYISETLDRHSIWLAQTPQTFKTDLIKEAHQKALKDKVIGTDDAALVERMGIKVKIIPGSRRNIKITTLEDLEFCSAIIG